MSARSPLPVAGTRSRPAPAAPMTPEHADIVIVGAGQAGLASAYAAQRAGLEPVVLEASAEPTGSWPRYYESLSTVLPGSVLEPARAPAARRPGAVPDRSRARLLPARLRRLAWSRHPHRPARDARRRARGPSFEVETEAGLLLHAPYLIAASGGFGRPHRPQLPGERHYRGTLLHASEYRRPAGFAGRRVVVVGGGNSAVQIAHELATVARVTLATRSPLKWQAQRPLGRDMHWWMDRTGLDSAPIGRLWFRLDGNPVVDDGRYRGALAAGAYDHRAMFTRLVADGVGGRTAAPSRSTPCCSPPATGPTSATWPARRRSTRPAPHCTAPGSRGRCPGSGTSASNSSAASAPTRCAASAPTHSESSKGSPRAATPRGPALATISWRRSTAATARGEGAR